MTLLALYLAFLAGFLVGLQAQDVLFPGLVAWGVCFALAWLSIGMGYLVTKILWRER